MRVAEPGSDGGSSAVRMTVVGNDDPLVVPDVELLFSAEYSRSGRDLSLTGNDGQALVIEDYFSVANPPDLSSPRGALLRSNVVKSLAGPEAPGQYAQAGQADGQKPIGQVETLEGRATVQRADGTVVELNVGDKVFLGDVVITIGDSKLGITFIDGTVFSLSEDARMVLDELVYSPGGEDNSMLVNLVQGTFVFVAGEIAPTGDMEVRTPTATLGIRGTTVIARISASGDESEVSLTDDPGGGRGSFVIKDSETGQVFAVVDQVGQNWVITPQPGAPDGAQIVSFPKTTQDLAAEQAVVNHVYQTYSTAQARAATETQESGEQEQGTQPEGEPSTPEGETQQTPPADAGAPPPPPAEGQQEQQAPDLNPAPEGDEGPADGGGPSGGGDQTNNDAGPGNADPPPQTQTADTPPAPAVPANVAPVVGVLLADQIVQQGNALSLDLSTAFTDADTPSGDIVTLTAALDGGGAAPAWLGLTGTTFAGTPGAGDRDALRVVLTATDTAGATAQQTFDILVAPVFTGDVQVGAASFFESIDPVETFLRTDPDADDPGAEDALGTELATLALPIGTTIGPGTILGFQQTGDFSTSAASGDVETGLIGLFSSSSTLLADTELHRVPGALETINGQSGANAQDVTTGLTFVNGLATDIAEDSQFSTLNRFQPTLVEVPAGATHAFTSTIDTFFGDNTDPDGDFGLNVYVPMVVGNDGAGTLTITGGSEYRDNVQVGLKASGDGILTITNAVFNVGGQNSPEGNANSRQVDGELLVGNRGTGVLNINSGSTVTVTSNGVDDPSSYFQGGYRNVRIGQAVGSDGTVNVDGAGTLLKTAGDSHRITAGRYGTGTLNVTNGAEVQTLSLDVGREGTAVGTVNISGADSKVIVSAYNGQYGDTSLNPGQTFAYSGIAGLVRGGRKSGAKGYFNITDGGLLEIKNRPGYTDNPFFSLGRDDGAYGKAVVDGAGSELRLTQTGANGDQYDAFGQLQIGQRGQGVLEISNGGKVSVTGDRATGAIGSGYGAASADPQSELRVLSGGQLDINSGNSGGYGAGFYVGRNTLGTGYVLIDGQNSAVNVSSEIPISIVNYRGAKVVVGDSGAGTLKVQNKGTLRIETSGYGAPALGIGDEVGGTGSVIFDGMDSKLFVTNKSGNAIGYSGNPADPNANITPNIALGNDHNATGTLTFSNGAAGYVQGPDAALFISSLFHGDGGTTTAQSTVSILSGSQLTVDGSYGGGGLDGGFVNVGSTNQFSNGKLIVDGAGSQLTTLGNNNNIFVGGPGTGILEITNGGFATSEEVFVNDGGTLSGNGTVDGTVTLSGSGTATISPGLSPGTLTITNNLNVQNGTLDFEINGYGTGDFDKIAVGGGTNLDAGNINLDLTGIGYLYYGNTVNVIESVGALVFDRADFGVKLMGASTDYGAQIYSDGNNLVVTTFYNSNSTLDFGYYGTEAAIGRIENGYASGTGGNYTVGIVAFANMTGLTGTENYGDVLTATGTQGVTLSGYGGDDALTGSSGIDTIYGGYGIDTISGGGGGDNLYGGYGNDTIEIPDATFANINADAGQDTLILDAGLDLDFSAAALDNLREVETIDLITDPLANLLTLDYEAVRDISLESNTILDGAIAAISPPVSPLSDNLVVEGDSSDTVTLIEGTGTWVLLDDGTAFAGHDIYGYQDVGLILQAAVAIDEDVNVVIA